MLIAFIIGMVDFADAQVPVMRGWSSPSDSKSVFQKNVGSKEKGKNEQNSFGSSFGQRGSPISPRGMSKKKGVAGGVADDPCPKSQRLAIKQGKADAAAFKKKTPWGTWSLCLYKFRQQYSACSPFIKRAYVEAARETLQPKKRAMFAR